MGITENNAAYCDFIYKNKYIELKTQRKDTSSNVTLLTKEPKWFPLKSKEIIEKYGYKDIKGRTGLKITLKMNQFNSQNLTIEKDAHDKRLNVIDRSDGIICYFIIKELIWNLKKKLAEHLLIVLAERKKENGEEFFHYDQAYLLSEFGENKFKELLESGKIVFEFRMHSKPSGTTRSHGSGFRIKENNIKDLYAKKEIIL